MRAARDRSADPGRNTVINPRVLVEVLSPSTEEYDRGEKLSHYKQIPSLQEILLIAHEEHRIERWRRVGDHWALDVVRGGQVVSIESIDCTLTATDVYRNPLAVG